MTLTEYLRQATDATGTLPPLPAARFVIDSAEGGTGARHAPSAAPHLTAQDVAELLGDAPR
jgi:hypothetical protein